MPSSSASDRGVRRARGGMTARNPSPITAETASTSQFASLKDMSSKIHGARRLGGIVLIVVDRSRQPVRHCDDGLIDPGPVLLVALAEALLRAGADHALVPGLQLGDVVLKAADRRRNQKQKDDEEDQQARGRLPLSPPDQIRQHRDRKNLDRGGQREHASGHQRPLALQHPETVEHHDQQYEIGLTKIEHVEDEGHGGKARQGEQPWAGRAARTSQRMRELRRHPPRECVED